MIGSKAMKRVKPIKRYDGWDAGQVPTVPVNVEEIMGRPTFERGVTDVRGGCGYPPDYEMWSDANDCWAYERGRQWALLVPRRVKLKTDGKVTAEAVALFHRHTRDIL